VEQRRQTRRHMADTASQTRRTASFLRSTESYRRQHPHVGGTEMFDSGFPSVRMG
jgi:hypothetical protein